MEARLLFSVYSTPSRRAFGARGVTPPDFKWGGMSWGGLTIAESPSLRCFSSSCSPSLSCQQQKQSCDSFWPKKKRQKQLSERDAQLHKHVLRSCKL